MYAFRVLVGNKQCGKKIHIFNVHLQRSRALFVSCLIPVSIFMILVGQKLDFSFDLTWYQVNIPLFAEYILITLILIGKGGIGNMLGIFLMY